ncbi:MAG TPA: ABC transporter substrate-binding protein [Ktedonobacteraceae bacterium]|nr:ABC transporter substrate-binding protein [Ktedonobacteraceae bacterium]
MECPYCKHENRDGVRYCSNCGRALSPTTTNNTSIGGTSRSLAVGTSLQGGRYVITKTLGEGGMGTALLATDQRTDNKLVVIKELVSDNSDPAKYQEDVRNFKREVATLAHLDHPLISYVTDSFEENSRYFMVQKYIEGENLEERMDRVNQPMKERDVLGIASEMLDILDYLEQQTPPIVHRDIKPANIIIGAKDKRAHLVDFGIARADEVKNIKRKQTSALGTPGYAPPEQYQGNADPRSDLYALGATMHHLLTNRDPRNYTPFSYPPARTLNPKVSLETENLISKATDNDSSKRYQSAMAMKNDVDAILLKRFGVTGNTGSYTLGTSGPMAAVGAASSIPYANPNMYANQPTQVQQPPYTPVPPPPPYQQGNIYAPPPRRQRGSNVGRNFLLFVIVIILLGLLAFLVFNRLVSPGTGSNGNNATPTVSVPASGIGVTKTSNGEYIGISDGTFAFDTGFGRTNGALKQQAAQSLKSGDTNDAVNLYTQAANKDTSDAESLIYIENQRVLASGSPYITIVVGTMITGNSATASVGRDDLQGAYVAQKSFNDGFQLHNGVLVRLLIANAGSSSTNITAVADQIIQLSKVDKTFVGVMGWPFSGYAQIAINVLRPAQIPMISQTASSDALTNSSPYFFRVAPPNTSQGVQGATYAERTLHATKAALFYDPTNTYTESLANAFKKQFTQDGNQIVATEIYTVGKPQTLPQLLSDAATHSPNLIYFAGYASDASVLLTDLSSSGLSSVPIMGGDALYELGGYGSSFRAGSSNLNFTTFAYPDEWKFLCGQGQAFACKQPAFFSLYNAYYDPNNQHPTPTYGYTRADSDTILSYDATYAMLNAVNNALTGNKTVITSNDLLLGIKAIHGAKAIQGVSGQIDFGSDGNPIQKSLVILKVVDGGFFTLVSVQPCFPQGQCS